MSFVSSLFYGPGEKEQIEKENHNKELRDKIRTYPKQLTGETRIRAENFSDGRILAVLQVRKKYTDENKKTWLTWFDASITDLQYLNIDSKLK